MTFVRGFLVFWFVVWGYLWGLWVLSARGVDGRVVDVNWPPKTSADVVSKIDNVYYKVKMVDSAMDMLLNHLRERTMPSPWVWWWVQVLLLLLILWRVW